ncbi:MAG: DUF4142 domain-containing protein [Polyangiaceae bacterium]
MRTTSLCLLPSILAALLAGCGTAQPAKSAQATPSPAAEPPASSGPKAAKAATSPMSSGALASMSPTDTGGATESDSPALSDDQIVDVTHTANLGEIEQAKLALSKAHDSRVRKLAAMMMKDHLAADAKGAALAKKDNLSPAPSSTSIALEGDAKAVTSALKADTGDAFDKDYVDSQVKEHQAVLEMIDDKLLPGAKSPGVKAYLADVRPTIVMHLQHAKDLQKDMAK